MNQCERSEVARRLKLPHGGLRHFVVSYYLTQKSYNYRELGLRKNVRKTFDGGSLGSCIDEERSQVR